MPTRRRFLSLLAGGAVAVGGVAVGVTRLPGDKTDRDALPVIRYGQERCGFCGMSIDAVRFAAAWRTQPGAERHFDDIGCLVSAHRRDKPPAGTQVWVHDYRTEEWLDAVTAQYVVAPAAIRTPMAYGVGAFASASDAAGSVPDVRPLAWPDVLRTLERKM